MIEDLTTLGSVAVNSVFSMGEREKFTPGVALMILSFAAGAIASLGEEVLEFVRRGGLRFLEVILSKVGGRYFREEVDNGG